MKTGYWLEVIEAASFEGKAGIHNVVAIDLCRFELVGRAVLCPPCEIHMIGAHGVTRPTTNGPHGRGYSAKRCPRKRDGELNPRWQRSRENCSFDRRQPLDRAA